LVDGLRHGSAAFLRNGWPLRWREIASAAWAAYCRRQRWFSSLPWAAVGML
jgi:hypothetical protein